MGAGNPFKYGGVWERLLRNVAFLRTLKVREFAHMRRMGGYLGRR